VQFERRQLMTRYAKGGKALRAIRPQRLAEPLREQMRYAHALHLQTLAAGHGAVALPFAIPAKYCGVERDWRWQLVFPASRRGTNPREGVEYRHHLHESAIQKAVKRAVVAAGVNARASCHTFRHALAGGRAGHPHNPGVAGPRGRVNYADLHPSRTAWAGSREEPAGSRFMNQPDGSAGSLARQAK
jgi:integrase